MLQNIIVVGIVIAAGLYLLRRYLKKGAQPSCGCGCSGCGSAETCAGADQEGNCPSGSGADTPGDYPSSLEENRYKG